MTAVLTVSEMTPPLLTGRKVTIQGSEYELDEDFEGFTPLGEVPDRENYTERVLPLTPQWMENQLVFHRGNAKK